MYPVVFSAAWFVRYQRPLLTALNAPVIGGELRDALGIRRHDLGGDPRRHIVRLLPHAYIVANPDGSFTLDVRTHAKYAKRLRHQFAPLWRAAHAWDRCVANPLVPALNLGFDTLDVRPDPNPETTSVDGFGAVTAQDVVWATIIAAAGNYFEDQSAGPKEFVVFTTNGTTNHFAGLQRALFLFDTSALTSPATVTAAVLSLFGNTAGTVDNGGNTPNIDIYTSTPASQTGLATGDFNQTGSLSQTDSPIAYGSWSTSAYNDFALNATGLGNISQIGVTQFAARNANYDVAAATPTWGSFKTASLGGYYADQIGSANDPKLVITFVAPSGIISSRTRPRPFAPGIAR